jgi:hypothetical protein
MKKIMVLVTLIAFFSCKPAKETIQIKTIKEVSFEQWIAGVQGGGSGINFMVELNVPLADGVTLQKVQFQTYEAVFEKISDLKYITYIRTKINQLKLYEESNKEYGNEAPLPNFGLQSNQARLFFIENKKIIQIVVDNVKEKPLLAYPSMNKPKN